MSNVIQDIEKSQLRKGLPSFDAGDRVRVHFQVIEGARRRTQVFEGIVLRRQGSGARETFTVRKQSFGVGVERTFPLHSPKIEKLEIAARGAVRRAKLYYLRGRIGKAARVAERRWGIDEELISAPTAAAEPEAVDGDDVSQTEEDAQAAGTVAEEAPTSDETAAEVAPEEASAETTNEPAAQDAPEVAKADEVEPKAPEAEPQASSEQNTDAEAAEAGETEDNAAADDAEDEAPGEKSDDSGGDSA
jgi:large subunit ribosomal protein L19